MVTPVYSGADYSQFSIARQPLSYDLAEYHNAEGNQNWETIFDQITGTGQTILSTAHGIKEQITGDAPIAQGDIEGGYGKYELTSGYDRKKQDQTNPLVYGLFILLAVGGVYFLTTTKNKSKTQ